ncbi:C1 family peptidase, partial [Shewanella sp. C32]|nr:C1 family peptidase [Shewanella electrica]
MDCDTGYNQGCNGGLMDYAFEFIINNGGIDSEEDYPYRGDEGKCDSNKKNAIVTIDGHGWVPTQLEEALKQGIANQPVAVPIPADDYEFQYYTS